VDLLEIDYEIEITSQMRLFFGLKPDPQTAMAIVAWRERSLPPVQRPVAMDNLHITLDFFGQVQDRQLEEIVESVDKVQVNPFEISLNQLGFWSKAKILWIGSKEAPDEIFELAGFLSKLRRRMALRSQKRDYLPHLSIARKCEVPPPASLLPPDFSIHADSFYLFESVNIKSGMRYQPIHEWLLG